MQYTRDCLYIFKYEFKITKNTDRYKYYMKFEDKFFKPYESSEIQHQENYTLIVDI